MLTARNVHKLIAGPRPEALLDALASNGFQLPLSLRVRLMETPASMLALALRRVIELSYVPNPHHRELLRQLLDAQLDDGSFGHDPLATSLAIASLHVSQNASIASADPEAGLALERALAALAAMQNDAGFFGYSSDRSIQSQGLAAAFIFATLMDVEEFRTTVRMGDLLAAFDEYDDRLDHDTQLLLQQALAPAAQPAPVPAQAA